MTLEQRLTAAFAVALAVVIALALGVFDTARRALDASRLVAHTHEVLQQVDDVEAAIFQAESAVRGFVITGEEGYLEDRVIALSAIESRVQRLRDLTADNELQLRRWRVLRDRVDDRLAQLDRVALLRQTQGTGAARRFLMATPPRALMRDIRNTFGEMRKEEQRLLGERARREELEYGLAVAAGLTLTAAFVLAFTLGYLAIRRQVAQTARLNAALTRRTEEVEAANRDLEAFSYSVSHDLRSPLRAMDGFSKILAEDYYERLDGEGRRLLQVIRDNSTKMGRLIDELLEFARLGRAALACSTIDMTALADETYRELRMANPQGTPAFDIAPLPEGWGDPAMMRHVWTNLLSNALKYAGTGHSPRIRVNGWIDGGEHVYCVKDNGVGFDMAYYNKLFGVFQRLHSEREFPGTGVGLAIVQRIVVRHGGRVWAESRPGEGASFYFSLPKGL